MAMICPICKNRYEQQLQCPTCAVRLQYLTGKETDREVPLPPHWSRTPWGRIALSVVLSMGLYYTVRQLLLAGALAQGDSSNGGWSMLFDVLSLQSLQLLALFCGSLFAGAGERKGLLYGAIVGVWNGVLCTLIQGLSGGHSSAVSMYGQPILNTAFGALGGLVGSLIWRPPSLPTLSLFTGPLAQTKIKRTPPASPTFTQVHWGRVLAGVTIAVGGVVWAGAVLDIALEASEGKMALRTNLQENVLTLEVSILAIFVGGAVAGAGTWNGMLQGSWVGILSASLLAGFRIYHGTSTSPNSIGLLIGGVLALSYLGGSFGSRLLPPLTKDRSSSASASKTAAG